MTRIGCLSPGLATVALLCAGSAHAQEGRKVGITMGYPAVVGIVWHASEKIAIRPDITFGGSTANGTGLSSETDSWNVGTTVAALFYMKKFDNVRTYVSPSYRYLGFAFSRLTSSSSSGLPTASGKAWGTTAGVGLVFYP